MTKSLCSKDLYCTFLKVTTQRYFALSLSEVSPTELSHDTISRWLESAHCQPKDIWEKAKTHVVGGNGVIIADDTTLNKSRSEHIELVGGNTQAQSMILSGVLVCLTCFGWMRQIRYARWMSESMNQKKMGKPKTTISGNF